MCYTVESESALSYEKRNIMKVIESDKNQWIKRMRALEKRKYRLAFEQFVAEGRRFVEEALESGAMVHVILIAEGSEEKYEELLAGYDGPAFLVDPEILEDSMSTVNPQDIAAIVSFPDWSEELWPVMDTVVVVDGVQDPGNLGSIIRSTLASGAKAVFCLKGTVDFSNKKVLRSTMGTIFKLPVYMIEDVEEIVQVLKKYGFKFIVADADGVDYDEAFTELPEKIALVVGNEGNGASLIEDYDQMVRIPLENGVESLNVGVATGVLLYEIRRRRKHQG